MSQVHTSTLQLVIEHTASVLNFEEGQIKPTDNLRNDLDASEHDVIEIIMDIEDKLGIHVDETRIDYLLTVKDLANEIGKLTERRSELNKPATMIGEV